MFVPALIGGLGPWELGIILVLVLIIFGAGKLPQVFESFGIAVKKFREAQKEDAIDIGPAGHIAEDSGIPEASEVRETVSENA
jgi:sec-independent protein translocase protein TatA